MCVKDAPCRKESRNCSCIQLAGTKSPRPTGSVVSFRHRPNHTLRFYGIFYPSKDAISSYALLSRLTIEIVPRARLNQQDAKHIRRFSILRMHHLISLCKFTVFDPIDDIVQHKAGNAFRATEFTTRHVSEITTTNYEASLFLKYTL